MIIFAMTISHIGRVPTDLGFLSLGMMYMSSCSFWLLLHTVYIVHAPGFRGIYFWLSPG